MMSQGSVSRRARGTNPLRIYLCDLTHDTVVLVSDTIPINIGFIAAYAKVVHGDDIDVSLFKYPMTVMQAIEAAPPDVVAFSNYSWNSKLSERIARFAKERRPRVITIQGGTNFPHKAPQQLEFLRARPRTDIYVELEADVSFAELIRRILEARDGGPELFEGPIPGCVYIAPSTRASREPVLVKGEPFPRLRDLDRIPSPYLNGLLDQFFDGRLTPFIETNRGCPFQCTFCHTGAEYFQKTNMFSLDRVKAEIAYIAPRAAALGIVNLHIADTNFGMYPRDRTICEALIASQKEHGWPRQIMSTTGKNNKERVIEITQMMGNAFSVNMSVQSMDADVLANVQRSNIKLDDYIRINQTLKARGRSTKGEVIIGLPGETRQSFVRGLERMVESGVSSVCSYTLMLLHGTQFKDPDYRGRFGIQGKFRIVPLDFGEYAGEHVFDTEEVGIATKDMSFEDYLWIRGLSLIVEILHNNRPFDELIRYACGLGRARFSVVERCYQSVGLAPAAVQNVVRDFMAETRSELWDSESELEAFYRRDENYSRLLQGAVGGNLIYKYKAVSLAFGADAWIDYLGMIVKTIAGERGPTEEARRQAEGEIDVLVAYVKSKLAGVLDASADVAPRRMDSPFDVLAWYASPEGTPLSAFALSRPVTFIFEYTADQLVARADYFRRYGTNASALSKIVTRVSNMESLFRKVRVDGAEGVERRQSEQAEKDLFVRYALSN